MQNANQLYRHCEEMIIRIPLLATGSTVCIAAV